MKDIKLTKGHKLIDNGQGDYDLICSDGIKVQFVPIMVGWSCAKRGTKCRRCDESIIGINLNEEWEVEDGDIEQRNYKC